MRNTSASCAGTFMPLTFVHIYQLSTSHTPTNTHFSAWLLQHTFSAYLNAYCRPTVVTNAYQCIINWCKNVTVKIMLFGARVECVIMKNFCPYFLCTFWHIFTDSIACCLPLMLMKHIVTFFFFSVSLLKDLPEEKLAKIIDCLEVVSFQHFIVSIALLFVGNAYLFLKWNKTKSYSCFNLF